MSSKATTGATCSESIWSGWGTQNCSRRATVTREGKGYCGQHDPEAVRARRAKRTAEWDAKRDADKARAASATARIQRLGYGRPTYGLEGGYTGGVTLSPDEADALIETLRRLAHSGA